MTTDNGGSILLALLTGVVIGAGVGILYAPNKGVATRHKIKQKVGDTTHDLAERIAHAKDELTRVANEKKNVFDRKMEETISTMSYKADDILANLEDKLEELRRKNAQLQK